MAAIRKLPLVQTRQGACVLEAARLRPAFQPLPGRGADMAPIFAIYLVWAVWLVSWWAAALWAGPTVKRAGLLQESLYRIMGIVGFVLLFGFYSTRYDIIYRFWRTPTGVLGWAMVVLVVAGFAFCWWARIQLGSSLVGDDHPQARSSRRRDGPLRAGAPSDLHRPDAQRHRDRRGAGNADFVPRRRADGGGLYIKARLEERFLRQELGPQAYDAYAKRVPMLIPFVRWPG